MTISTQTLEDAIKTWQHSVDIAHPLFQLPVETAHDKPTKSKKKHKASKLWMFATDKKKVMAHLYEPEIIDQLLRAHANLYQEGYTQPTKNHEQFLQTLSFHNSLSLLIHELFHNLYCPDSKEDKKKIYQALAKGIKKAMPKIPAADLVAKVKNIENLIWDFTIDTFQYHFLHLNQGLVKVISQELATSTYQLDGKPIAHLPEGVLTIFDVVSCAQESKLPQGLYAVNRFTYSLLFCQETATRKKLLSYFEKKIKAGGILNIEELVTTSLKGLTTEISQELLTQKRIDPVKFYSSIDDLLLHRQDNQGENISIVNTMTSLLLDKRTRYDALCGYIQPLAQLIDVSKYDGRCGHGSGGAGETGEAGEASEQDQPGAGEDPSETLDALLEDMSPQEANQFLQQLSAGQGSANNPYNSKLSIAAKDSYYKQKSPTINLKSQDTLTEIVQLGKRKEWVKDFSVRVMAQELYRHLPWIKTGVQHRLPVLVEIVAGKSYQVTYFKEEETPLESYQHRSKGIDVARNWILINDSSDSMGGGEPGCGSSWDTLLHINYGLLKTLYHASQQTTQDVDIWVINFSGATQVSGPVRIQDFYESSMGKEKGVLVVPQNGGTTLRTEELKDISQNLKPGRTVWSFATDGGISNANGVYQHIQQIVQRPEQSVLFFDLFLKSSLGQNLKALEKTKPNLKYFSVSNLQQILTNTLDVLIQYEK